MIEPEAFVLRSDEAIEEMARAEVVAFEVVALRAVKFWRVVEPFTRRVPVKFAADEIVCPLTNPEVIVPVLIFPRVEFPAVKFVVKRFVLEAVVANEVVEVAFEDVEFPMTVKLPTIVELA
jgi:hypothetical protein